MSVFDKYLFSRDNFLRRRIEIDESLFEELEKVANKYDATINKLVNIAIIDFIEKEKVGIYKKNENETARAHNFSIRESSYNRLIELKGKYRIINL